MYDIEYILTNIKEDGYFICSIDEVFEAENTLKENGYSFTSNFDSEIVVRFELTK